MRPEQAVTDPMILTTPSTNGLNRAEAVRYDFEHVTPNGTRFVGCLRSNGGVGMSKQKSRTDDKHLSSHVPIRHADETHAEKLARIKAEIEAGEYDTDEKLEAAIERLLGVLSAKD